MNELTTASVNNILIDVSGITLLKNFTFDAKYNKICDVIALDTAL